MMFGDVIYWAGQVLGVAAVVLGFASFQMKTPRGILAFQIVTALVFSAHYLLIGAPTAVALNLLAAVNCVVYYFRDRQGSRSKAAPIVFTLLVIAAGILTWEGWYSAFIVLGLAVNSISLAFPDAQKIRGAMFVKSPCCLVYNAAVLSGGGVVYECAVLASAVIGMLKHRGRAGK